MKFQVGAFTQVELKMHGSEPVHLTPREARELAKYLNSCAGHAEKNQTDLNNREPWTKGWEE